MPENVTGAADWRSEQEKRKSLLRKAVISLFKIWIPDHPEASVARGEVAANVGGALTDYAESVSLVSLLSFGSEDMFAHDFASTPLSMQELLVQREGTDAFLDPKNALRVVRRKFGMMTLIARMASTFEQRNIVAIRIHSGVEQLELIEFAKAISVRVEGTAAEEEIDFKRRLRQAKCEHFEVLYHSELIGRRQPVPWPVKEIYSLLGRRYKKSRNVSPEELVDFAHRSAKRLNAKALRQLSLFAQELMVDLDANGLDPFSELVKAADDRLMLTATRSIFDEFQEIRTERRKERALEMSGEHQLEVEETSDSDSEDAGDGDVETIDVDTEAEFLAEAEDGDVDDEFLRLAKALELIRTTLGKPFFHRISMVSGDVNFVDAAMAGGGGGVDESIGAMDPLEALRQAREVTEPFYKARSLASIVPQLLRAGRIDEAGAASEEALTAARGCQNEDLITGYSLAIPALLHAEQFTTAATAVEEVLGRAHQINGLPERASALMRIASTLMESGALPPTVKRSLSRSILGHDIHFWGKEVVKSPLVEVILSLLSDVDDDTLIFLQKVAVHPDVEIRRSVLRTLPLGENEHIRSMLVSHLKDSDARVRVEVLERIGWSGDGKLAVYLVNHFRQDEAQTQLEKRALALNLARLSSRRHLPIFNAMLGKLATKDDRYVKVHKPIKDDPDYQKASLEVLYHLRSREARRVIYNAAHKGRGDQRETAIRLWNVIKSQPYAEPTLPRSPHDPDFSEEDEFNFTGMLAEYERVHGAPVVDRSEESLFGRIKASIFGSDAPTEPPTAPPAPLTANEITPARETTALDSDTDPMESSLGDDGGASPDVGDTAPSEPATRRSIPLGPARAGLRIEAVLSASGTKLSGVVPMKFSLYPEAASTSPLWIEDRPDVTVTAGRFEVLLGVNDTRLPGLPEKVWLGIEIEGDELEPRSELSKYRSVVQG